MTPEEQQNTGNKFDEAKNVDGENEKEVCFFIFTFNFKFNFTIQLCITETLISADTRRTKKYREKSR